MSDHPNGPRTFAMFLRDNVPLPDAVLDRMLALEEGRHPTLTELRHALGLDLNINGWGDAARNAWFGGQATPDDTQLSGVLDAMYRSLSSPRIIRAEMTDRGVELTRAPGAIAIREGEHLQLLAFAENRTGGDVSFSIEARGEGTSGRIEAGRNGSAIFDAGPMPAGAYLLPAIVVVDGSPKTIDLPIECSPSGTLAVRIIDETTREPCAARVYLADGVGPAYPVEATVRRDLHGNAFFHADGSFDARVSGRVKLRVVRGVEYEAALIDVTVASDQRVETTVRLRRWSHMAADGWYSGDVHVHLHYGGEYLLEPSDAALAQRAEDVNFMNMMVANQGSGWVHDHGYFSGAPHELSDGEHILQWGEEYRNDFYGHMCMYGINELVPPIYSGVMLSEHADDLPANVVAARHCHSVGGTLSYAHPLFESGDLDRVFSRRRTVEAKELPVDAALGAVDALDVMSYPGHKLETAQLWYRLLNCGQRLPATAGTDTFMNLCDSGEFSNPPAGDRVFAKVDGAFSTQSWCEAVRAGRTFVTNGPMLSLTVDGRTIGDGIEAKRGDMLRVDAEAGSYAPMQRIELIVNGAVVASADATEEGRHAALSHELRIDGSCWIAMRAQGSSHEMVLDPDLFAHTSPMYVSVAGAPVRNADDARYFVEWIERLITMSEERGHYATSESRDEVIALFREGQARYRAIAEVPA